MSAPISTPKVISPRNAACAAIISFATHGGDEPGPLVARFEQHYAYLVIVFGIEMADHCALRTAADFNNSVRLDLI